MATRKGQKNCGGANQVHPTTFSVRLTQRTKPGNLENVPQADDDAPVSSVRSPLVEEVGRRNRRIRNSKVSRVGEIEEISSDLKSLAFTNQNILQNAEINVIDSVRTKDVSSRIPDPTGWKSDKIDNYTQGAIRVPYDSSAGDGKQRIGQSSGQWSNLWI